MKTLSDKGAEFIARFEGFVGHPYNDPLGYATIGYGHLLGKRRVTAKDNVKWGYISHSEGLKLLQQDAASAAASVRNHVKAKLSQAQFDALVSFTFNVGSGGFEKSTLLRLLNGHRRGKDAADVVEAQLLRWVNKGTPAERGLRARRQAEARLFRTGQYQ